MKSKVTPAQITKEVAEGVRYKEGLNLFETVKRNEKFYIGEQWDGLKVKTFQPLTMNFLRRTCSYFQSMILSDDISYDIRPFAQSEQADEIAAVYEKEIDRVFERTRLKTENRNSLRDAIVDGDCVKYFYFDPSVENGQAVQGEIAAENLMNTNVIFGNPYSAEVQSQPYLIIQRRRPVRAVRESAKAQGCDAWEAIAADDGSRFVGEEHEGEADKLCTENVRFWKENGKVHTLTSCGEWVTREETETQMTLYPIAYMGWEERKNSYHGVSPMTEVIPTQIAVNRMWTAVNVFIQSVAFPKMVYNKTRFPDGWDSNPGKAVGVRGDPREAVTGIAGGVQLPAGIVQIMETIVQTTRDFMGANDAALGNVRADNTSAIIALQKASSAPLEMKRLRFYQFIEDCIRIILDIMAGHYGVRTVTVKHTETNPMTGAETETEVQTQFDFGSLPLSALACNIDVGQASYWSELISVQTADALFQKGVYTDMTKYLEALPDSLVPGKSTLIRDIRKKMEQMAAAPPAAGLPAGAGAMPGGMPVA